MTADDRQELRDHEGLIERLEAAYVEATDALATLLNSRSRKADRVAAFHTWRKAGTDFFNAHERLIVLGAKARADSDPTWRVSCAETAAALLAEVHRHYETMALIPAEQSISMDLWRPTTTAFAGMQRLVKAADPVTARHLRDEFARIRLPTYGFDTDAPNELDSGALEARHYVIGVCWSVLALGLAIAGFAIRDLSPDQRRIINWVVPIAAGVSAWSFSGTITVKGKHPTTRLLMAATGGFAVWLLTHFFMPQP